jgi:hypothetical protein
MTTIVYTNTNKVIQVRHVGDADLVQALKKFGHYKIVKDYQDIRKIDKDITTLEWFKRKE